MEDRNADFDWKEEVHRGEARVLVHEVMKEIINRWGVRNKAWYDFNSGNPELDGSSEYSLAYEELIKILNVQELIENGDK